MITCAYSICKNESKNVDKFLDSLSSCDYVVIVDTGSEDDTYDKIQAYIDNVYEDKLIDDKPKYYLSKYDSNKPFSFSEARNTALRKAKYILDENNENPDNVIFISMDFDEFLFPGSIEKLSKIDKKESFDVIKIFSISPLENTSMFVDTKIHRYNFEWYRSIHETIRHTKKKHSEWIIRTEEDIKYNHIQDTTKKRNYYEMLQESYKEDPHDIKTLIYLSWEAALHNDYENMWIYCNKCISEINTNENDEYYNDQQYMIQALIYKSIYWKHMGMNVLEAGVLKNIIETIIEPKLFPDLRIVHYLFAEVLWKMGYKKECCEEYEKVLSIYGTDEFWVEDKSLYKDDLVYSKLSTAYFYLDEFKKSIYYAISAYKIDESNTLYKNNIKSIFDCLEIKKK